MSDPVPKQPLSPSVIPLLDPEYVAFHNAVVQYFPPIHTLPLDPNRRNAFNADSTPWSAPPLKVGYEQDFDSTHLKIHTFTPEGMAPSEGWPVFVFFHGGAMA
jgi:acetyl esterase/lipase